MQDQAFRFPNVRFGIFFSAVLFGIHLAIAIYEAFVAPDSLALLDGLSVILLVPGIIYWYLCIYWTHKTLRVMTRGEYPVTPGRAAFYSLIPLFQIYWIFRWPAAMARFINDVSGEKRMRLWYPGAAFILAALVSRFLDTALALFINFIFLQHLIHGVNAAVQGVALPIENFNFRYPSRPVGRATDVTAGVFVAVTLLMAAAAPFLV